MPELQAYMVSTKKTSSEYSGLVWAQYDSAYSHQADNSGTVADQHYTFIYIAKYGTLNLPKSSKMKLILIPSVLLYQLGHRENSQLDHREN